MIMQPMDLVKTRVQIGNEGMVATARGIVAAEGVRGLYSGLTAQLLRAWTYAPARFGVYLSLTEALAAADGRGLPFLQKVGCGLAAGAAAAIISNPAEVAIIRMQVDSALPKVSFTGLAQIVRLSPAF